MLGSAYWTRLLETKPPLLTPDVLRCPVVEQGLPPATTWGPSFDPATLKDKDPLGCDKRIQTTSDDGKTRRQTCS